MHFCNFQNQIKFMKILLNKCITSNKFFKKQPDIALKVLRGVHGETKDDLQKSWVECGRDIYILYRVKPRPEVSARADLYMQKSVLMLYVLFRHLHTQTHSFISNIISIIGKEKENSPIIFFSNMMKKKSLWCILISILWIFISHYI